jgi:hypothetical protein
VLDLIFPDWNCLDIVSEDISCHEDRVVEDSHIDITAFPFCIFEAMRPEHE